MRKLNIRLWTRRLTLTAREAPAEMLLALYFFAIYSLNREHALSGMADYLPLMPIFFALRHSSRKSITRHLPLFLPYLPPLHFPASVPVHPLQ